MPFECGFFNPPSQLIKLLWCRFELSFFYSGENSSSEDWPWCAVFSSQEMSLLEKNEDLHYYVQDGYHYNISREMTGVLLNDLLGMTDIGE